MDPFSKKYSQLIPGLLILLISFLGISCSKSDQPAGNAAKTSLDISYGSDPAQKMDIYLPGGRSTETTPVMVLIHGGAWTTGDKDDFDDYIGDLQKRIPEYALFNLNYRLAKEQSDQFPTQENDIGTAVQFILDHHANYQVSDKWVILGASAGAQLALLQAYKASSHPGPVAAISFFAPTDLVDLYQHPEIDLVRDLLETVTGGTPDSAPTVYFNASPINFVTDLSPPTLILQGGVDSLVPPRQADFLKQKLDEHAIPNDLILYPDEGHGWFDENLQHSFDEIKLFLEKYAG